MPKRVPLIAALRARTGIVFEDAPRRYIYEQFLTSPIARPPLSSICTAKSAEARSPAEPGLVSACRVCGGSCLSCALARSPCSESTLATATNSASTFHADST
jgi:hypothetical protein